MLKELFEMTGEGRCAVGVTQLVDNHRCAKGSLQQGLCNPCVRVNPRGINRPDPGARNRRYSETPVLAVGRKQLHRVAYADLKQLGQPGTDDDRGGGIPEIIEIALNQLLEKIGGLRMESGINPVKINCRIFKSRTRTDRAAQNR